MAKVPMNMGVVYYDAASVKYAGARQILYSYVYDFTTMDMVNAYVSSCDIQPYNGVVHVIRFTDHYFGFDRDRFLESVVNAGVLPLEQVRRVSDEAIQGKKEGGL